MKELCSSPSDPPPAKLLNAVSRAGLVRKRAPRNAMPAGYWGDCVDKVLSARRRTKKYVRSTLSVLSLLIPGESIR